MVANARFLLPSSLRQKERLEEKAHRPSEPSLGIIWLNDDIDRGNTVDGNDWEEDDLATAPDGKIDSQENIIPSQRDLEDFARLWIHMPALQDALKSGQMQLGLKWTNITSGAPAIKMYPAVETDGGTKYLTDPATAYQQIGLDYAIQDARDTFTPDISVENVVGGTNVFILPKRMFQSYMQASTNPSQLHLLFEGVSAGAGELQLVILDKDGNEIGQGPGVWMDLKAPKEFIQRWSCGDADRGPVVTYSLDTVNSGTFTGPSADEEKDMVLYVHGYNMQPSDKQRWIETTYKRLWHLGYKGRVGGFSWPCSVQGWPDLDAFDVSEERAWQAAAQLKQLLIDLKAQGYRVHVLAHSQGNVVMGEALRQAGPNAALASTYLASQGAIAAHCYDAAQPDRTDFTASTPNVYQRFWTTGEDAYRAETWQTTDPSYLAPIYLQGSVGRFVNFYNAQDWALMGNGISSSNSDGTQPGWRIDQRLKPNNGGNWGYNSTDGFIQVTGAIEAPTITRQAVTDMAQRYQVFSYCAQARSLALGTVNVGGVFNQSVDLSQAPFSFLNQHKYHSGQFRSNYALRWQYWKRLLDVSDVSSHNP